MDQEAMVSGRDGGLSPVTPPENFHALTYENKWDPKLVIPAAENIKHAATLGLKELEMEPVRRGKIIIVGSGPSVLDHIEKIREFKSDPANQVFAVNRAHGLLIKNGIIPDGALVFEIEKRAYEFLEGPQDSCTYYICSICDPYAFEQLKNNKCYVWHCWSDIWEHLKALHEGFGKRSETGQIAAPLMVGGGFTTFLRTLTVGFILGWRDFELFGVESSYEHEHTHFFGTPDYGGERMPCYAKVLNPTPENPQGLKKYESKAYLIRQADEFRAHCEAWHKDFKLRVWGNGLLPDMHRHLYPRMYEGGV